MVSKLSLQTKQKTTRFDKLPLTCRLPLLVALILLAINTTLADDSAGKIFKWVDKNGQVHFSTSKNHPDGEAAELPEIKKENIDDTIAKLREQAPQSCIPHGGVDCSKGADSDGSVICLDGFTDALLPFRFRCLEVKLKVDDLLVLGKEGTDVSLKKTRDKLVVASSLQKIKPAELVVVVRNLTDVDAKQASARFYLPGFGEIAAEGPQVVEPYGVAEYKVRLSPQLQRAPQAVFQNLKYKIRCVNCRSSISTY